MEIMPWSSKREFYISTKATVNNRGSAKVPLEEIGGAQIIQ